MTKKNRYELSLGGAFAAAWEGYISSEDGRKTCSGSAEGEYLKNRLWRAFEAGWNMRGALREAKLLSEIPPHRNKNAPQSGGREPGDAISGDVPKEPAAS